jgi:tRNA A-37 threonylcarbamoyl transferase component Bud32
METLQRRNHGLRLLEVMCQKLQVTVRSFLGAGAFGRCFMVERNNECKHKKYALKIVLTLNDPSGFKERLVHGEFEKLCALREMPYIINVDENSLRTFIDDGVVIGVGYLMEQVGVSLTLEQMKQRQIVSKLLKSLEKLHKSGYCHGDSRVANALLFNNEVVWVDLTKTLSCITGRDDDVQKRRDLSDIIHSIYGGAKVLEPSIKELLLNYPSVEETVESLVELLTDNGK